MSENMTLAELADAAGIPARTIRFYISRGMLAGPLKAGRGAAYGAEHLERLRRIQQLQAEGHMLSEIGHMVEDTPSGATLAPPTAWWQQVIADDVVVWTRADAAPWRTRQIRTALEELARKLETEQRRKD